MPSRSTHTLILSGLGTNCEKETQHASQLAGASRIQTLHILSLPSQGLPLEKVGLLVLAGGFLDGDALGAARVCANRFLYQPLPNGQTVAQALQAFVTDGGLILGVCNGFQLLVQLGLLGSTQPASIPSARSATASNLGPRPLREVTLARNANGCFENRWVNLLVTEQSPCVFTRGLQTLALPVRCGEGQLLGAQPARLKSLVAQGLAPLRYADANHQPTQAYPANPCGSGMAIAALCNPTGTVMGVMPHPEAFVHVTQHPQWTRDGWRAGATSAGAAGLAANQTLNTEGAGLALFRNAYAHLQGR